MDFTYSNVINHHFIEAARSERAFDDICNSLSRKYYRGISI